jgi:hypothetical protein
MDRTGRRTVPMIAWTIADRATRPRRHPEFDERRNALPLYHVLSGFDDKALNLL